MGKNKKERVIEAPLFLIFSEYLGYYSRFTKICEEWCEGKIPDLYIQKLINVEAKCAFRKMKQDYTNEEINKWFDSYYDILLKEHDEALKSIPSEETVESAVIIV